VSDLPPWLKHATVWLLLALALFLGVQAWLARERATRFTVQGNTLELRRAADGHYHWPGRIGGRAVEFLVDTGATGTALPAALARELGLPAVGSVRSSTAGGVVNGTVVLGDLVLDGGVRVERLQMAALPNLSAPLLGMDVLGKLRLRQDQGVLRIELQGAGQ
jgi:aspartyl protease family protein